MTDKRRPLDRALCSATASGSSYVTITQACAMIGGVGGQQLEHVPGDTASTRKHNKVRPLA